MAAGKIFAISFAIGAVMNATFGSARSRGSAAMQQLSERTRYLNSEQQRLDRAWRQSQSQIQGYAMQMQRLRQQYEQGRISESQYQAGMARAQQGMRTAGMSADEYRSHLARLRRELEQTRASAERLRNAQAAQASASARLDSAKAGMGNAIAVAGMVAAPLFGAVETAAKFEAAMSKVQAITRANGEEIGRLTAEARRLGETTQFSAQQSAEAMSYLGMAGWNTEQIIYRGYARTSCACGSRRHRPRANGRHRIGRPHSLWSVSGQSRAHGGRFRGHGDEDKYQRRDDRRDDEIRSTCRACFWRVDGGDGSTHGHHGECGCQGLAGRNVTSCWLHASSWTAEKGE